MTLRRLAEGGSFPLRRIVTVAALAGFGLLGCVDDGVQPGPVPLEGVWVLADLNGTPPPVIALSGPDGAIEILEARLAISANDSLVYSEYNRHGVRLDDESIEWLEPVWVELPGMIFPTECSFEIRMDDAILVLDCLYEPGASVLTVVVPEGHGVPERRLRFQRVSGDASSEASASPSPISSINRSALVDVATPGRSR